MAGKARGRTIRWQKTQVITTKKKYNGESSPYWEYMDRHTRRDVGREYDQENSEYPTANPDVLADPKSEKTPVVNTRALMKLVLKKVKLSRVEKAVLNCIGLQGFTEEKTAETLNLTRRRVRVCLSRAQKKCEKLFGAILGHAGVIGTETYTEDEE